MDHFCDSADLMASGVGERPHDGWSHSCSARHRHHRLGRPAYSGTKTAVATYTLAGEGEASGKEAGGRSTRVL